MYITTKQQRTRILCFETILADLGLTATGNLKQAHKQLTTGHIQVCADLAEGNSLFVVHLLSC